MRIGTLRLNKWGVRALLAALIGIGGLCRNPYTTNPNLRLLVGDTTSKDDSFHCFNPVVSSNGERVYYLSVPDDSLHFEVGSIYSISINGLDNKEVLRGYFNALAISPGGQKLAAHLYTGYDGEPESLIVVIDLNNFQSDSFSTLAANILDIEFSNDGQKIYYSVDKNKTLIYRLNLPDSTNEFILDIEQLVGFDLLKSDSIYLDYVMMHPQINPVDEVFAIGTHGYEHWEFLLCNTTTHELDTLPDSLMPYSGGTVGYLYWLPNGQDIVFMAKPYSDPAGTCTGEIWILENLFEQIEE